MARRSGLGKGISSLIPHEAVKEDGADGAILVEVMTAAVVPNPHQPRKNFEEETLVELAASIAEMGVLQPILVRPLDDDRYELIAGERRWRAAQRTGLSTIPAIVRTTSNHALIEQALVENLHRQDLTSLEEAAAYQQLLEDFGLTHAQLSERIGRSRTAITNTIRLLGLPPVVQSLLAEGSLSAGHARALLGTPDRNRQEALAQAAAAEGWSVRAVEEAVRSDRTGGPLGDVELTTAAGGEDQLDGAGLTPATSLRPPGLLELEELLAEHLQTRVSVRLGARRGKVTIDFADLTDLERIYRQMVNI